MVADQSGGGMLTVPALAVRIGVGLDRLRRDVRGCPDLAGLLEQAGPVRVLPVDRLEEFRAAYVAARRAKTPAAAG